MPNPGQKKKRPANFPVPSREPPVVISGLGVDLPELRQARALWQHNRFDESLQLFDKAVRAHPQNLVALIDASRAFGTRFEITRAEEMVDRLFKLAAGRPEILHLAGQTYRMIYRPDKALECFRRVVAATKQIPDAQLELAVLYERVHRLEDAFSLIENCLRAVPGYWEAHLFKARLLRRMKDEAGAEALFRKLSASETAHPQVRAQAWTEIAQLHDRHGDYDAAMTAMLKCKTIMSASDAAVMQESDSTLNHLRKLADSLTQAHFERWAADGKNFPARKMAVLCSFPRSGTTLLEQVLDGHPGLVSSDERETFARDIFSAMWQTKAAPAPTPEAFDAIPQERLTTQRQRYLDYMSAALNEPIGERFHLDKNPTLTLLLPGILRLFPETKLFIALRDPRDVVMSCFMQYLPLNTNSVWFLTLERTAQRYANDMGIWRKFREIICSPWLEVRYEDCVMDLEKQTRRALEFLGLPWEAQVLNYRERLQKKAVSSPTYEAVSKPLYTTAIGRWKNYQKYLEPVLEILQPSVEAFKY